MIYSTIQHPSPPPHSHTLSVYTVQCVHLLWEEGRGGRPREGSGVTEQQYTSIVSSSNGNASETKANESFDNGVFFDIESKQHLR